MQLWWGHLFWYLFDGPSDAILVTGKGDARCYAERGNVGKDMRMSSGGDEGSMDASKIGCAERFNRSHIKFHPADDFTDISIHHLILVLAIDSLWLTHSLEASTRLLIKSQVIGSKSSFHFFLIFHDESPVFHFITFLFDLSSDSSCCIWKKISGNFTSTHWWAIAYDISENVA